MSDILLSGRELSVAYGGVKAVQNVDLDIHAGEVVGLIGPNGAGKTSLMDGITGFAPLSGSLRLRGRELSGMRAHRRRRAGISRTWQSVGIFDDLTVEENIAMAAGRGQASQIRESLEGFGLAEVASRLPGELSHGQRVLVGVARARVGEPDLILMDEPAAGLSDIERAELIAAIRSIVSRGAAVLLVDHDMEVVFGACDQISVLDFGKLIAHGTPEEIKADPAVAAAYLGTKGASDD